MRDARRRESVKTMSKQPRKGAADELREMRTEYRFDYSKAKPNPYADKLGKDTVTVVLDPMWRRCSRVLNL